MNNCYYETLDENFEQALNLCETSHTHSELLEFLKSGNIVQKQIAALKLETINSIEDAQILVSDLVGQDGKIREAVSLRLNGLCPTRNCCRFLKQKKIITYF